MSNLRTVLERQLKEGEEIQRRSAEEDRDADEEKEQMLAAAVCMLNQSRQHHRRCAPNVDRRRESQGKNLLEDYFIPNSFYHHDAVGVLGLIPEQKLTAALRMLACGASTEQVDKIARMGKSTILECLVRFCDAVENLYTRDYLRKLTPRDLQRLLQKGEARGFLGMIGSIDCMHWQWKNCPIAWQREYGNQKGQKSIILEAVASFDCWVWHAFFGVAGSQNDLNVLGQSPAFDEVL
ncbi:PREDICTED: uncharacterized protein LOC103330921 [Prunus mume]|uniref:Uncharacterized protein LOC103330921 n=1 Tax=Prunus mume TaxID=102107 RepID=A0ABM0NYK7_PRUMU|nr:PREDICTED: uncharacterized protein LOC103330921 [Prunus mume]